MTMDHSSLDHLTSVPQAEPPQDTDWLPIREVSRLTGVNAVTLRAWERRYGLIVPHRTAKGHRLYSHEHVQRILTILTWLNRGVAVSQVALLLDTPTALPVTVDSDWERLHLCIVQAIAVQAERQLDDSINQAISLYPPRTVCEQLLLPLLAELEQRWQGQFGAQLERVFFHSWLRSKLGARIYHNNRQLSGPPLLLVNHSALAFEPHLWLSAWLASSADCPVEVFDWPLPAGELALAVEHLKPRAVVLYASTTLNVAALPRLLAGCGCPVLISGPAVCIHSSELLVLTQQVADVSLAENPLAAIRTLTRLGLI